MRRGVGLENARRGSGARNPRERRGKDFRRVIFGETKSIYVLPGTLESGGERGVVFSAHAFKRSRSKMEGSWTIHAERNAGRRLG